MQVDIRVESLKVELSAFTMICGGTGKYRSLSGIANHIEISEIIFKSADVLANCVYDDGIKVEEIYLRIDSENYPIHQHISIHQFAEIKAVVLAKLTET